MITELLLETPKNGMCEEGRENKLCVNFRCVLCLEQFISIFIVSSIAFPY